MEQNQKCSLIESFIDSCNQSAYSRRYSLSMPAGEITLINSVSISECRHCGSSDGKKIGKTSVSVQRCICFFCGKSFTALTNTIFDSRKIFISEWQYRLPLSVFGYASFSVTSESNRNEYNLLLWVYLAKGLWMHLEATSGRVHSWNMIGRNCIKFLWKCWT